MLHPGWGMAILARRRLPLLGLVAFWLAVAALAAPPVGAQNGTTIANDARLAGDRERTRFVADLSKKVEFHVFSLADPYRVIVDLPDVSFQLPPAVGQEGRGLVTAYRYGLLAPGKSRIVIDVAGPFLIDKAMVIDARDKQPARLIIDLVATGREAFLARQREAKPPSTAAIVAAIPKPSAPPPSARTRGKPVVVIDPGHGGIDPGAVTDSGVTEKSVVFAFAKTLRRKLRATGKYDVYMTREIDTFVPLRARIAFAREKGANLFISIHADSIRGRGGSSVEGATVYTLSEEGSDEEAKALAAKENRADIIAGVELPPDSDEVTNILIDLAQRETNNRSTTLAQTVLGKLKDSVELHRKPHRSAAFAVLKAPDVPSVLLELGYLTSAKDAKRLTSAAWRATVATGIEASIEAYFADQVARMPF